VRLVSLYRKLIIRNRKLIGIKHLIRNTASADEETFLLDSLLNVLIIDAQAWCAQCTQALTR
jgi:hypothetical protein